MSEETRIPKDSYTVEIKKAERKESQKESRPMIRLDMEIVGNANDKLNGEKLSHWCMVDEAGFGYSCNLNDILRSADMPTLDPSDANAIEEFDEAILPGVKFYAILVEEEFLKTQADGKTPIMHPKTGEPVKGLRAKMISTI